MRILKKYKTRLIILIVVSVVSAAGATGFFVVRKQRMYKRILSYRPEGIAAVESGDFTRAISKLGAYLNHYRDDAEALYTFSLARRRVAMSKSRHLHATISALLRVLKLQPDYILAQEDLLKLYREVGFATEAISVANEILERDPDDWEVLHTKTLALMRLRRFEEALEANQRAAQMQPNDLDVYTAGLFIRHESKKSTEKIIEYAEDLRKQFPEDTRFVLVEAIAYRLAGDMSNAAARLRQLSKEIVDNEEFIHLLMNELGMLGLYPESSEVLRQAVQQFDRQTFRNAYAAHLWEMGREDEIPSLLEGLDESTMGTEMHVLKALVHVSQNEIAETRRVAAILTERNDPLAKSWTRVLTDVLLDEPSPREAIEILKEALQLAPADSKLYFLLGRQYANLGESARALDAWREAANLSPTWSQPRAQMAQTFIKLGRNEEALQLAQAALARLPSNIAAAKAMALAAMAVDDSIANDQARMAVVGEIQSKVPNEASTLPLYVTLLSRTGRSEEAITLLKSIVDGAVALDESTLLRLVSVCRDQDLDFASELMDRSEQLHGITPTLAYSRAIEAERRQGTGTGAKAFSSMKQQAEATGTDYRWQLAWATFLDRVNDPRAQDTWIELADNNPTDVSVQRSALNARSTQAARDFIDRTIERTRRLTGEDSVSWRIARARWLLNRDRSKATAAEAAKLLNEILAVASRDIVAHDLLATCLLRIESIEGAIEHLKIVASVKRESVDTRLRLASLYQSQANFSEAREWLKDVLTSELTLAQGHRAAVLLVGQGEIDQAIQTLAPLVTDQVALDRAHALLADLYWRKGDLVQARALFDQIVNQESPPSPGAIQLAANFFAAQGEAQRAEEILATLEGELDSGAVEMILAEHYSRHGDPESASDRYRAATEKASQNPEFWQRRMVFHLGRGQIEDFTRVLEDARDALPDDPTIVFLASHENLMRQSAGITLLRSLVVSLFGDAMNRETALTALRICAKVRPALVAWQLERRAETEVGGSLEDLGQALNQRADIITLSEASLKELATDPNIISTEDALSDPSRALTEMSVMFELRRLADQRTQSLSLQEVIVALYSELGQHDDAAHVATRAMETFPSLAQPAALAAAALGRAGHWDEALGVAQRWRQLPEHDKTGADQFIAMAQLNLDRPRKVLVQLEPYLEMARAEPDKYAQIISLYVLALVSTNRNAEAAELLWPLTDRSPRWQSLWQHLATNVIEEAKTAAEWLERAETIASTDDVMEQLSMFNAWVRLGKRLDIEEYERAARSRMIARAQDPDAHAVDHFFRGVVAELQGERDVAEASWRRALELDTQERLSGNNALTEPDKHIQFVTLYVQALILADRVEEATQLLQPLIERPGYWRGLWLTLAASVMKDGEQAASWLQRFEHLIEDDESEAQMALLDAWTILGRRLEIPEYVSRARERFVKLATGPNAIAVAAFNYATLVEAEGDLETAEASYRRTLSIDPNHVAARNNLAYLLAVRGTNTAEAVRLAQGVVSDMPDKATFLDTLAYAQIADGRFKDAQWSMESAIRLQPDNIFWQLGLVWVLTRSGEYNKAREMYDQVESDLARLSERPKLLTDRIEQVERTLQEHSQKRPEPAIDASISSR